MFLSMQTRNTLQSFITFTLILKLTNCIIWLKKKINDYICCIKFNDMSLFLANPFPHQTIDLNKYVSLHSHVLRRLDNEIWIHDAAVWDTTSWDELSSHQAEAVSLKLVSSYGYITSINHGEWGGVGAIIAQVGFNLHFDANSGNLKLCWFL